MWNCSYAETLLCAYNNVPISICCCPLCLSHLVQVKCNIKSSFRYMVSVDANLAQLRPSLSPTSSTTSPLLRPDLSLDIILENGSHATNTLEIFQLYYTIYGGRNVSLPASEQAEWSNATCMSANGKQMQKMSQKHNLSVSLTTNLDNVEDCAGE